ncbi:hypothetical protein PR202_gb00275 [Eleusine coracana subsp. coracana]|uniref:Reverse transcriptase RNase H-like domain-containing protein n=1 Tax=Eleusine coracana subsp. coracana TaxID=191504 RepID=A0AAV5DRH9_ELECO|nr:hypothetical protein PR202_gb00275 [Eleusine coracana subsp. coracana]
MIYSDHAPILAMLDCSTHKPKKPFRFENWWLMEDDFTPTARQSWCSSNSKPFHKRTKILGRDLKVWSKKKKPINSHLAAIENQLLDQQNLPLQQQNYSLQGLLHHNHQAFLTKDVEHHRQRVKDALGHSRR